MNLPALIGLHADSTNELLGWIQAYMRDQTVNLDKRWNVFTLAAASHILPIHDSEQDIEALDGVSWYDDFYKDKYTTVSWGDIVKCIENDSDHRFFHVVDQVKEDVMQAGYGGFIYDW